MKHYICINNVKTELTEEQVGKIREAVGLPQGRLSEYAKGDVVRIGGRELIVLEQSGDTTAVCSLDAYKKIQFGKNNNYDGSDADKACEEFADEIASAVGEENLVVHTVDLTTHDGMKDYGKIRRRASAMTADRYRRYVNILDNFKLKVWCWLATAFSTKKHDSDSYVLCVAPSGFVVNFNYYDDYCGVRPFCILKSNIFVSD